MDHKHMKDQVEVKFRIKNRGGYDGNDMYGGSKRTSPHWRLILTSGRLARAQEWLPYQTLEVSRFLQEREDNVCRTS